ncbi:MAG: aminoacyl-tRNA hydrolase [Proteobacteria bacterium]|jgi:peptidyl-tRNA hydrolase, PTH1 family|nr:aminoacyl-tRNA hydrolase [Pseudomonadota bacterium]
MHLVVGLGNPGPRYVDTRHNAGFLVIDRLGSRWNASCDKSMFGALVDKALVNSCSAVLAKPQKFMNRSGHPVSSVRGYYKIEVSDIVVVHDDVDLPLGRIKVKSGGGHGGHKGVRDITQQLGNSEFVRIRFGVSRPPEGWDTADYVLQKWNDDDSELLGGAIERAADAVEAVLRAGVKQAMNDFNSRVETVEGPTSAGTLE